MRKRLTAVALAGTVGLGGLGAAVAYPALADSTSTESPQAGERKESRISAIREALKGLVDDKTITSEQADKVADTLGGSDALRGPGMHHRGGGLLGVEGPAADEAAAKVLGLSVADLRTALREGSTLAELATKQGKDVDTLVNALVTVAKTRLSEGVKAGRISQEMATQIEKTLEQRVRSVVQNGRPGPGMHGEGRGFGRGSHEPAPTTSGATTSPSSFGSA